MGTEREEILNAAKRMNAKPTFDTRSALTFAYSIVDAKIFTLHQLEELADYLKIYCMHKKPF